MRSTNINSVILVLSLIILPCVRAAALEVDVDEIRTRRVEFINYKGDPKKADPLSEVEAIGRQLSKGSDAGTVRFHMKYSIIRAVSKEEPDKYSADIFSIDRDAKVGHIDTVRRIAMAYLSSRYGYSRKDGRTLALFLSYYNAVHRGDIAYFGSKYKGVVMKHIAARNAGISTKYWEWPGTTKMLIPLTEEAQKGKLDAIQPDVLSDRKTIDQLRKSDKNIPDRKNMADLRERTLEKDTDELKKKEKRLEQEKEALDRKKEQVKKKEEDLKKEKEETKKIIEPEKRREKEKEIEKKEKELTTERKETQKREETSKKKETSVADEKKKLEERKKSIDEEKKQIKKDEISRDIKKDPAGAKKKLEEKEKELDKREDQLREKELDKNIYAGKLYYLKIQEYLDGGHYNNNLYMINASTRKIMFKSPVENICGNRYDVYSGGIVIITHRGSHTSGHRLTLVDKDTLQAKIYGDDNIFWRSFIEIRDGFIYAITYDSGVYHLGRFDGSLKLVAKSKEELSENTFISFWDNYIYINRQDKKIIVLNRDDLTFIDEVKP